MFYNTRIYIDIFKKDNNLYKHKFINYYKDIFLYYKICVYVIYHENSL